MTDRPAGRELDRLIAALIGDTRDSDGWWVSLNGDRTSRDDDGPWHYSTRIEDAWRVVEWLRSLGWRYTLTNSDQGLVDCCFWRETGPNGARVNCWATADEETEGPAVAICRAALRAEERSQ